MWKKKKLRRKIMLRLIEFSKFHNGTIIKRIAVPDALKNEILVWCHDRFTSGHLGISKTLERIKQRFYWKNYKIHWHYSIAQIKGTSK